MINNDFVLYHNPLKNVGLEIYKSTDTDNLSDFIWDENTQQLHILKWPNDKVNVHVRIVPGIKYSPVFQD